jgi:hypothetical protein
LSKTIAPVKLLFLLFLFQDVGNVVLAKLGWTTAVPLFSSIKEILLVVLLAHHWLRAAPERKIDFAAALLAVLFALLLCIGVLRGMDRFPLDGILFELRTLVVPVLVFWWGRAFVETRSDPALAVERMVRFYVGGCLVFAASGLVDYLFLDERFWIWIDVGAISRAKGYVATTSGALPDNMYSYFFGRRAFGLAFNPLNLAYMLIPALLFSFYRRQLVRLLILTAAFVLTFSRLPFLATAATLTLASVPRILRVAMCIIGAIAVGIAVYAGKETLFADPSASGHFSDVMLGLLRQLENPLGEGVGAAGVYAGNYSALSVESAVLNTANQITLVGLAAYVLLFVPGLSRSGPLHRELRLMAGIYGITAIFAPQILVIKSTFAFFFFLGANAALAGRFSIAVRSRLDDIRNRQPI